MAASDEGDESRECLQWSLHALLAPLRLVIDSRAAGPCWFALREGWLRDQPEALVALRAACDQSRLQPYQQVLSWSRRAKDVGTTNCIRPKAALATATSTAQWSPARREAGVTAAALLAICRLVALMDELHDCLEEAPSALSPAAATRLLGRLCTISRTHALRNFAVGAVEMERASSHLAALVPTALRLWVTSAGAERASPLALLRRLFEVVAADASPCGSSCAACKRCRDASVPPPSASRPPEPATAQPTTTAHPIRTQPPPQPQPQHQPQPLPQPPPKPLAKPQPKPPPPSEPTPRPKAQQPASQPASQLLSQLLPQVKPP